VNILRQDLLVKSIQDFIKEVMKETKFLEPPGFDLESSFKDSNEKTPIIFVLSPGADPLNEVRKLADKLKLNDNLKMLSLGQGQSEIAKQNINKAQSQGSWVVLQNCHLAISFMPELEKEIEKFNSTDPGITPAKPAFRLWLTSMPSDKFPVSILQNGIKLTNEPPKGIKSNLLRSYNSLDKKLLDPQCTRDLTSFKKLLFGLSFFNALILERRKYGPLGWNIPYEFSQSDLAISISQLHMFNNEYKDIPWEALNYMAAEANYGGRVTDPMDRRTIKTILNDFYTTDILKDDYRFCPNKSYFAPPEIDLNGYLEYIKTLPLNDPTEVFGLHSNADITSAINDANSMLSIILSLLPRIGSGSNQSQEMHLEDKANQILSRISDEFNIENVARKHPIKYEESMNTVLQQELLRFNNLIKTVKLSLVQLQKAIKGLVIMSTELDAVSNSLFDNTVPEMWQKVAYPSLKPLGAWITDFVERLKLHSHSLLVLCKTMPERRRLLSIPLHLTLAF
jgi:dynein heavy chain, axonemal